MGLNVTIRFKILSSILILRIKLTFLIILDFNIKIY